MTISFSEIDLKNQFIEYKIDISDFGNKNIKSIRFILLTDDECTIYLDSFICDVNQWRQRTLCLNKIEYKMKNNSIIANANFGDEIFSFINEILDIKNKLNKTDSIQSRKEWS